MRKLDYNSPHLKPLKTWMTKKEHLIESDTPIDSKLGLSLDMKESNDVQLLTNLAPFTLPPIHYASISSLSEAIGEAKHFLIHSLGKINAIHLNRNGDLLNGSEWVEVIVKALPRIEKFAFIKAFKFSKEQVEAIIDNSFHLESLQVYGCQLRK
jgi:hypothetical protein